MRDQPCKDVWAIRAAFNSPRSSGQVQGQINRSKYPKRMYGRAKLDLLHIRVLHRIRAAWHRLKKTQCSFCSNTYGRYAVEACLSAEFTRTLQGLYVTTRAPPDPIAKIAVTFFKTSNAEWQQHPDHFGWRSFEKSYRARQR